MNNQPLDLTSAFAELDQLESEDVSMENPQVGSTNDLVFSDEDFETAENIPHVPKWFNPKDQLPDTILGMKVDPDGWTGKLAADMIGLGHGITNAYRGVKQLAGIDIEEMKDEERFFDALTMDEDLGNHAVAADFVGNVLDPVVVGAPGGIFLKGAGKALLYGMGEGAVIGSLGYVDKSKGESRAANAMLGGLVGGGASLGLNRLAARRARKATERHIEAIDEYEHRFNDLLIEGYDGPTAKQMLDDYYPGLLDSVREAVDATGKKPRLAANRNKAIRKHREQYSGLYNTPERDASRKDWVTVQLDEALGNLYTRVQTMAPKMAKRIRDMEYNLSTKTHELNMEASPFASVYYNLNPKSQHIIHKAMVNGNFRVVENELVRHGQPGSVEAFQRASEVFKKLEKELVDANIIEKGEVGDYWHRKLKDPRKLMEHLGVAKADASDLMNAIKAENRALVKKHGRKMSAYEEADFIAKYIESPDGKGIKDIIYAHGRKIKEVNDEMLQFYADPVESINAFIRNATWDLEKAKFFGKDLIKAAKVQQKKAINSKKLIDDTLEVTRTPDVDNMVESYLDQMKGELSNLNRTQMLELKTILRDRFSVGEQSANVWMQRYKSLGYAAILGNPLSALTQVSDIAAAMYRNSFNDALIGVGEAVMGKSSVTTKELGLANNLLQEVVDASSHNRIADFALKWSGFNAVDRLGKATLINSSLRKAMKAAQNPASKEFKKIEQRYRNEWGKDFFTLMDDLKKFDGDPKNVTENMRLYVWNELSDMQPISLSEVPAKYLRMPNGRVLYMMKTFLLKQFDIMRKDVYRAAKNGNKAEATKNAARYLAYVGGANMGIDEAKAAIIAGLSDEDYDSLSEVFEENPVWFLASFFKTFGLSEHLARQVQKQGPANAVAQSVLIPPLRFIDDVFWSSWSADFEGGPSEWEATIKPEKIMRNVPIIGKPAAAMMKGTEIDIGR